MLLGEATGPAIGVPPPSGHLDPPGPHHLDDAERTQHLEEAVDLVLGARRLDDERLRADIDDAARDRRPASCITCVRESPVAATLIMARSRAIVGSPVMLSTRRTGNSLYRFASTSRAPRSSVSTTMVIRESPGVSVCPTVSDSMLKARRRNSEATRFRTPGLLSTYTANVCIPYLP